MVMVTSPYRPTRESFPAEEKLIIAEPGEDQVNHLVPCRLFGF
jgi:hypothetical protein